MQQLINALLKYKNSLFYLGLLLLSLIFLNQRSFYHQSFFSDISLSISSRINLYSQGIVNYFSLKKINQQLRLENENFKLKILKKIKFSEEISIFEITKQLNEVLEKMIKSNPDQWIWSHNRWKI